jgi:pyruvate oxidase
LGIVGDAATVIGRLRDAAAPRQMDPQYLETIRAAAAEYDKLLAADAANEDRPVNPGAVIQALRRQVSSDAIICSDVGDHTYWFYKRFICDGQKTLLCANMAGMGFGIPAAVACQFAEPRRQVIAITGDGGFGMAGMELTTAVRNKLPITVIVFNEGKLKNIGKEQDEFGFERYRIDFPNPDFAEMATSAGGLGIRVTEPEALDQVIRNALDSPLPALVEVMVDPELYIKPVRRA